MSGVALGRMPAAIAWAVSLTAVVSLAGVASLGGAASGGAASLAANGAAGLAASGAASLAANGAASLAASGASSATGSLAPINQPWLDTRRSADERAALAIAAMTLDEKIGLLHGFMAVPWTSPAGVHSGVPPGAIPAAGYVPGVPRLGIPALYETDASLGVANPDAIRPGDVATALPSGLALASSFDPTLAYRAGALIGSEARAKGFNVLLAGGVNLARDPRNGRNFEYLGEDPLLAGMLAGDMVRGIQDQGVISTVKHFALNANETNRQFLDARIDRTALRESDLLAFQIAIERGHPGAVMCAYNKVNGDYACGNHWLLDEVLKGDWHYPGWVMSDWGAVHGIHDALNGLDQESGQQLDSAVFFDVPLRAAVTEGSFAAARIDDMVHRILRSMFAVGVDHPPEGSRVPTAIDYAAHAALALEIARKGVVLLKNEGGLLPLTPGKQTIALIGGFANLGVLSGGGSAQVIPANGPFVRVPLGGIALNWHDEILDPSAPLDALHEASPDSLLSFDSGAFPARAAALAARAEIAIVFATRHELEGIDIPNLDLPEGQDALIGAVVAANPHTIVVLETGNPAAMPWLARVPAVLASWYPGQEGGHAIADILFGAVNPSGRLAITFPRESADLVRPTLPNLGSPPGAAVRVDYSEAAEVGYRGYWARGVTPMFAFGYGLSYTQFDYGEVKVSGGRTLNVTFTVRNSGASRGADVPQLYLISAAGVRVLKLIGFQRIELAPGESRTLSIPADPRLLGYFDEAQRRWRVKPGMYAVRLGRAADNLLIGGQADIR